MCHSLYQDELYAGYRRAIAIPTVYSFFVIDTWAVQPTNILIVMAIGGPNARADYRINETEVLKRSKYSFIEAGATVGKTPSLVVAAVAAMANLAYQRPTLDVLIARVLAKVALIYLIALSRAN
jgi:hypothetical protein